VGVAKNPRSGVGARGSSVKKCLLWAKNLYFENNMLPLLACRDYFGLFFDKIPDFFSKILEENN
jgi:hypothetical protein